MRAVLRAYETGIDEETSWEGRDARRTDTRRRACRPGASSVLVPVRVSLRLAQRLVTLQASQWRHSSVDYTDVGFT